MVRGYVNLAHFTSISFQFHIVKIAQDGLFDAQIRIKRGRLYKDLRDPTPTLTIPAEKKMYTVHKNILLKN